MIPAKFGDVLSTILPGALAIFAIAQYFPTLNDQIQKLDKAGATLGLVLLMAAALAGGVLEAFTRITWEPYWLRRKCKPTSDALSCLSAENLDLYERGVQSSYKWVTFYANFAWASTILWISRLTHSSTRFSIGTLIITLTIVVLLRASYVQWTYFVNYQNKVFGRSKLSC